MRNLAKNDEIEPPPNFDGAWRWATFSADVYTAGLRWPATTLPGGVLSLFESGVDDPAARVLEGAAALLLARVYRRKASRELTEPYLEYARSDRTRGRMNRMRRGRVRLTASSPRGEHFDLDGLFDELNGKYFAGQLQRPHIGWSTRSWRRQFGCYDPGPNQILLNRRMDRPSVPACAVEYVLFHEMLHVKHPTRRSGCSMVSHSREFREEEKRFAEFERARRVLDRLAR